MIASRELSDLHPHVARLADALIRKLKSERAIDLLITSTYRDAESQAALYRQGRTVAGNPCSCGGRLNRIGTCARHPLGLTVTNAKAGYSFHNYRLAFDVVPLRYGKTVWGTRGNGIDDNAADDATDDLELWQRVGAAGESLCLEWAGRWRNFRELPHFQFTGGLSIGDLLAGKTLPKIYT